MSLTGLEFDVTWDNSVVNLVSQTTTLNGPTMSALAGNLNVFWFAGFGAVAINPTTAILTLTFEPVGLGNTNITVAPGAVGGDADLNDILSNVILRRGATVQIVDTPIAPNINVPASVVWTAPMAPLFVSRHSDLGWVSANHRRVMIVMADGEDGSRWTPTLGANDFFAWSEELNAFDGLVYMPGTLDELLVPGNITWERVPTTNVIAMYGLLTASLPIALADVLSVARLVQGQGDGAAGNVAVTPLRYLTSNVAPAWGTLALPDVLQVSRMVPANGGERPAIVELFDTVND